MAKKMKKALCLLLSVLMAVSCFTVSAFAYTGYDRNGQNNNLRVQSVVSVDKSSYSTGETVTATITLNHLNDSVIGYQGYIAFDGSKLDFKSVTLAEGFEYFDDTLAPSSAYSLDPAALTNGYGGTAFTAATFARLLGTATFSSLSAINLAVLNLTGLPAGSGDLVATVTFEAKAAVSETNIALIPSVVYSSTLGYLNCAATTSTDGKYETAFSAIRPSSAFAITGGSADVYYDITFTWHDGSTTVNTKENTMPEAPSVPDYSDGDYDYTFSTWSPTLALATSNTSYAAQYSSTFVSADYEAYNAAVAAATAKRDNGTNWTDESVAALNEELGVDVSGLGRTAQTTVDEQTAKINAAAGALAEKAATYTIRFENEDGTLLKEYTDVPAGTVVNYDGATPAKAGNAQYSYTFAGWDKEVVAAAGDTTYTATFTQTVNKYVITFKNEDGTVLQSNEVEYGATPAYTGATPEKASTAQYSYEFDGWTPEIVSVTGAATYTATFKQTEKKYNIRFFDEDGTQIGETLKLAYGATITAPADPEKSADNTYTYSFAGWTPAVAATVTGDADYTATYTSTYIDYTIKFVDEDGSTVIKESTLHYGDAIVAPADPTKAADDTYTYTFAGWTPAVAATVTGDATYTANYTSTYIDYTITFNWNNGGTSTVKVHWGETPAAPSVPSYEEGGKTYSFASWSPAVAPCSGDATYTAVYSSEDIYYNITFVIEGVSDTQSVKAGVMPTVPELVNHVDSADGDYDINFTGWDKEVVAAAGDATYTAHYTRDFVAANYTAVNAQKAAAQEVNRDIYTDDTLADLDEALSNVVEGLGRTKQDDVNAMAAAIESAIGALEPKPADYTDYNNAVAELRAELAKSDYTPDSVASVTEKLETIDSALDKALKITAQGTVDEAAAKVAALKSELVIKADKTTLKSLIDEADLLSPDIYTDFSAVDTALRNAENVYDNDNATNEEVASAITALRAAIEALEMKPADYSEWNLLEDDFANIETQYYTPESVEAVREVLSQVVKGQKIDYQGTLNSLVAQLAAAIDNLELIKSWAGELDYNGVNHEYFYSNLEFEQVIDDNDPTNIVINVYLNHPLDAVDGIQIAALYDAAAMTFKSANINGGTAIYTNTGDAAFNPEDYGLSAMGRAAVLKIAADFDSTLDATSASRDLIATLNFTATGASDSSYIKAVPLASNTTADKSVYSALLDVNGTEKFMHNDAITLALAEVDAGSVKGTVTGDTGNVDVTVELTDGTNTYTQTIKGKGAEYSFDTVLPGTYEIKISATGSLGYTIKNVVVTAGTQKEIEEVYLLYGDFDSNGIIAALDITRLISNLGSTTNPAYDLDGNGIVAALDITIILNNAHFGKDVASQVLVLD